MPCTSAAETIVRTELARAEEDAFNTVKLPLRTLSPRLLSPEDYVDLSDSRALPLDSAAATPDNPQWPPYIHYGNRGRVRRRPQLTSFPVNTRGFFYYQPHYRIPFGGSIRFRVCQAPDPKYFHLGQDLLTEYGTTWQIPLVAIGSLPRFSLLRSVLQKDGLIPPNFWTEHERLLRDAYTLRLGPNSQVIYECGEPFYVDLSTAMKTVYVATPRLFFPLTSRRMVLRSMETVHSDRWSDKEWASYNWPFESRLHSLQSRP
ncbi:hypothetical protein BN946_scf185008.g62 [Trametes cinnabarina]|uniref:Uncharacterized protein n=1 Tax=Pycnoporus cinnabarinus TaxID=5643 RepID=A0A060SG30_PYCCI|nr:hypothetical protein BN946_scf185008.g62 [Trametes cinnabarina]